MQLVRYINIGTHNLTAAKQERLRPALVRECRTYGLRQAHLGG